MDDETKKAIGEAVEKTVEAAEETVQRPGIKRLARLGFFAKGFLFVIVGSLAIMLLTGYGGKIADPRGALRMGGHARHGRRRGGAGGLPRGAPLPP